MYHAELHTIITFSNYDENYDYVLQFILKVISFPKMMLNKQLIFKEENMQTKKYSKV